MQIALHGGKCCGIKTICHLGSFPSGTAYQKEETSTEYLSADRNGSSFESSFDFFWESAPKEKKVERLDRMLGYLERVRHFGLVEVVLAVKTDHACDSLHDYSAEELELGKVGSYDEAVALALEDKDEYGDSNFWEGGYETVGLQDEWIPELEKRGFREVSRFPNVNSGNEVAVFHLVMNGDYYKAKKGK